MGGCAMRSHVGRLDRTGNSHRWILACLSALALLAGCSDGDEPSTVAPSATPSRSATATVVAQSTATASPTPTRTATRCPTGTPCSPGAFRQCGATPPPQPDVCSCTACVPCPLPECDAGSVPVCDGSGAINTCDGVCRCVEPTPEPSPTPPPAGTGRCTEAVECVPDSFFVLRSQESCCDLALSLSSLPFSWCPASAIDPASGACSQCVAHPCIGLPTRTPTSSPTATHTPEVSPTTTATPAPPPTLAPLATRMRDVIDFAAEICPESSGVTGPHLAIACDERGCGFDCNHLSGHGGSAGFSHFDSLQEAADAFALVDQPRTEFHGLPASFWTGPFPVSGVEGGSSHHGAFLSGCWLATASAYDDTHYLLAPQPSETLERIYQRAAEIGLFNDCGS